MRILVTGGSGFHGSHLTEKWLSEGHVITILNTHSEHAQRNISKFAEKISIIWGSVTDQKTVNAAAQEQDAIVHLAAQGNVPESISDPLKSLNVNILGTANVLESVRGTGTRIILASTSEVYGYTSKTLVGEADEMRPNNPYSASKAGADRLAFAYHNTYGVNVTIMRPCNVYGERQKCDDKAPVIPRFVRQGMSGKPITLHGDGSQQREFIHVRDLVEAYNLVLQSNDLSGIALNIGTGENITIKKIAEFVANMTESYVIEEPNPYGNTDGPRLDSTRIKSLGFKTKIKFWDGLTNYVKHCRLDKAITYPDNTMPDNLPADHT